MPFYAAETPYLQKAASICYFRGHYFWGRLDPFFTVALIKQLACNRGMATREREPATLTLLEHSSGAFNLPCKGERAHLLLQGLEELHAEDI